MRWSEAPEAVSCRTKYWVYGTLSLLSRFCVASDWIQGYGDVTTSPQDRGSCDLGECKFPPHGMTKL
eukprot:scaffold4484_cov170-Amphora_coffeaeformis.AAC.2